MDEEQPRNLRVPCLSTILELPEICHSQNLRLSSETNRFMVYQTLKKVGPTAVQKILSKCVEKGEIQWDKQEEFEVEQILDHRVDEDGKNFYFIKWFGWAHKHNTWEPEDNLNCPDLLKEYHENKSGNMVEDEDFRLSKKRRIDDIFERLVGSQLSNNMSALELLSMVKPMSRKPNHCKGLISCQDKKVPKLKLSHGYCNPHSKGYREKKRDVERALKEWETKLNGINTDPAPITVENKVDLEGPPDNFIYINDYRAGDGIEIPQDPLAGCECTDCYENKKSCCALFFNTHFAYYKSKRVRVPPGTPVYECNKRCQCGPNCPNRVVQFGRNIKVCIFRTANGRGWGVKTLQKIKKGTFVMEYVGEVITSEEAERRGKVYDAEGRTYLFDLDYNDGDCPFTVDAGYYGNVSHFVNHSCDPNLVVFGVWINTVDPRLPRIALFANRDIAKGEELTFDYMMTGDTTRNAGTGEKDGQEKDGEEKKEEEEQDKESGSGEEEEAVAPEAKQSFRRSRPLETEQSLQTSPEDGAEPNSKQYRMVCQCGSATCRKYLF